MSYRPYTSRTVSVNLTATTTGVGADLVYKVPDRHEAEITFMGLSNGTNSNKKVSVQIKDNGSYLYLLKEKAVAGNTLLTPLQGDRIFLKAGDEIRAYREAGDFDFFVSLSVKQFYRGITS